MRKWFKVSLIAAAFSISALSLHAQTEWPWVWMQESPSLPPNHQCGRPYVIVPAIDDFYVGCYDVSTGNWLNCETLWMEYFSLDGVAGDQIPIWNGGHEHGRNSGDFDRTIGPLFCALDISGGSDPSMFYGFTQNQVWEGVKAMPEASGVIRMSVMFTAPWGWYCVPGPVWHLDPTDPTLRRGYCEAAYRVQVNGLTELPESAGLYSRNGETTSHPMNHYGATVLIEKIQEMARQFQQEFPGYALSFNDMSLPWGGLFDIHQDWNCPHSLHRLGHSVDVDHNAQAPGGGTENIFGKKEDNLDRIAATLGLTRLEADPDPERDRIHYEL